jgi:hypothetical protein
VRTRELACAAAITRRAASAASAAAAEAERALAREEAATRTALEVTYTAKQRLRRAQGAAARGLAAATGAVGAEDERRRAALVALKGTLDGVKRSVAAKADVFRWVGCAGGVRRGRLPPCRAAARARGA